MTQPLKIIIAGSRNFSSQDFETLYERMDHLTQNHEHIEVVSGTARGADSCGEDWAADRRNQKDIWISRWPADWRQYGKSAGYKRNEQMAAYADALVAFWDGKSKGTKHMIKIANEQGLDVRVIRLDKIPQQADLQLAS